MARAKKQGRRANGKKAAQLNKEIAASLAKVGKHKGDRYVGMSGSEYRQGWDDAGSEARRDWRMALGDETLKVVIDALLEGDVERGFKILYLTGSFEAALENQAFRKSGLSSGEQLEVRRDPERTKGLVAQYKRTSGRQYQTGYVDRVLDTLEKKVGMREA